MYLDLKILCGCGYFLKWFFILKYIKMIYFFILKKIFLK